MKKKIQNPYSYSTHTKNSKPHKIKILIKNKNHHLKNYVDIKLCKKDFLFPEILEQVLHKVNHPSAVQTIKNREIFKLVSKIL
jgi:hypothetical protein